MRSGLAIGPLSDRVLADMHHRQQRGMCRAVAIAPADSPTTHLWVVDEEFAPSASRPRQTSIAGVSRVSPAAIDHNTKLCCAGNSYTSLCSGAAIRASENNCHHKQQRQQASTSPPALNMDQKSLCWKSKSAVASLAFSFLASTGLLPGQSTPVSFLNAKPKTAIFLLDTVFKRPANDALHIPLLLVVIDLQQGRSSVPSKMFTSSHLP